MSKLKLFSLKSTIIQNYNESRKTAGRLNFSNCHREEGKQ